MLTDRTVVRLGGGDLLVLETHHALDEAATQELAGSAAALYAAACKHRIALIQLGPESNIRQAPSQKPQWLVGVAVDESQRRDASDLGLTSEERRR